MKVFSSSIGHRLSDMIPNGLYKQKTHVLVDAEFMAVLVDVVDEVLLCLELIAHLLGSDWPVGQIGQGVVCLQIVLHQVGVGQGTEGAEIEGRHVAFCLKVVYHLAHLDTASRNFHQ